MNKNRAFTLIELLVVISIVALLSSVVMASLNTARSKSRDAKRLADMRQIQIALTAYHSDNGVYPSTGNAWWGVCSGYSSKGVTGAGGYIPNLAPTYISELPVDPKPVGTNYCYIYRSNATDYIFLVYRTVENMPVPPQLIRPLEGPSFNQYAIYTPGASGW